MIERIKLEDIPNHPWMQNDIDNPDKDPIAGSNESGLPIPSRVPPAHHQQTLNSVGSSNSRSELQQRYSMILNERSLNSRIAAVSEHALFKDFNCHFKNAFEIK